MADAFDQFLASALAPPERLPDRRFVAAVHARILVEDGLARERRRLFSTLVQQFLGLAAVGAGIWVIGRAAPAANWLSHSPALGLAVLIAGFALLVALLSARAGAIGPLTHWAVPEH